MEGLFSVLNEMLYLLNFLGGERVWELSESVVVLRKCVLRRAMLAKKIVADPPSDWVSLVEAKLFRIKSARFSWVWTFEFDELVL